MRALLYFIFSAIIILADRLVKMWIAKTLEPGQVIKLIPGFIQLTHVENTGAAFSLMTNQRWLLVTVSIAAVIGLIGVVLLYRDGEMGRLGAAFVLGGAVGNLIDRIASGRVVDMFEFTFVRFAIFNVADIFITVGGAIFILHVIIVAVRAKPAQKDAVYAGGARIKSGKAPVVSAAPAVFAEPEIMEYTESQILEEYYLERQMEENDKNSGE